MDIIASQEYADSLSVWVVRHGETEENCRGVIQGQGTGVLSRQGLWQMARTAEHLYRVKFSAIYSSDLPRAMESAQIIQAAGHSECEIQSAWALREWHLGVLEGLTRDECQARYPKVWQDVCTPGVNAVVPGGETRQALGKRVNDFLDELAAKHQPGEKILLVTHGGAIRMMLRRVVGELLDGNRDGAIANASVSRFHYYPASRAWQLMAWNNIDHLE